MKMKVHNATLKKLPPQTWNLSLSLSLFLSQSKKKLISSLGKVFLPGKLFISFHERIRIHR